MEDVNIDDVVNKQFNYPKCIAPQEIVTKELHSDDELSERRLIAMLERGEVMPDLTKEERSQIISDLPTNATLAIVVRASAQSYHEETRRLESISTLNPEKIVYASKKEAAAIGLPFPSYLNLLMIRFSKVKGVDPRTLGGKVNHALRIATPKKFGFPNGSVDYWKSRGLEKPYAYALTKPEIRNAILHHASLIMIEKDPSLAPGLHHLHTMGNVGNLLGYDNSEAQNGE